MNDNVILKLSLQSSFKVISEVFFPWIVVGFVLFWFFFWWLYNLVVYSSDMEAIPLVSFTIRLSGKKAGWFSL